ncbi:MAG TPA: hypothetical protein PLK77_14655 [Pyrinomonadaceae bacterium]|nr:hypothetical protein [Pyrinomonadaceae bacterium]
MKRERRLNDPRRRPYWLPASTYYFLMTAVAIAVFFLVWAILAEAKEENPWIAAGLVASTSMIAAIVVREVILRHRRHAIFLAQKRLDRSVLSIPVPVRQEEPNKLTLERNAILLGEITRKSEAAKVLGHFPESHREVFELCAQYISVATKELPNIGVGSPRLAAIQRGRAKVESLHKEHMLRWAEIEIRSSIASVEDERFSSKLDRAKKALRVAVVALESYPDNSDLINSRLAIEDFILSMRIGQAVQRAERAEGRGELEKALDGFIEAKRLMQKRPFPLDEEEKVTAKIEQITSAI